MAQNWPSTLTNWLNCFVRMSTKNAFSWQFSKFSAKANDFGTRTLLILSNFLKFATKPQNLRGNTALDVPLVHVALHGAIPVFFHTYWRCGSMSITGPLGGSNSWLLARLSLDQSMSLSRKGPSVVSTSLSLTLGSASASWSPPSLLVTA